MRRPRAPEGLDTGGAALWKAVTATYELSPAELQTLRQCCRQVDLIARLDEMLARRGTGWTACWLTPDSATRWRLTGGTGGRRWP